MLLIISCFVTYVLPFSGIIFAIHYTLYGCDVIGPIYVIIKSRGLKLKFMRVPHFEEKRVVGRIRRKDVSVGHNRS